MIQHKSDKPMTETVKSKTGAVTRDSARSLSVDSHLADVGKGPYHGPFETVDAAIHFLHKEIRKRTKNSIRRKS